MKRIVLLNLSSPVDRARLDKGRRVIEMHWGPVEFLEAPNLFSATGYLAGSDADRVEAAEWAFSQDASHIWAVRGGFGITRIIDRLDLSGAPRSGATLIGFSDVTPLLVAFSAAGGRAVHAAMPGADLGDANPRVTESISRIVFGEGRDEFSFTGEISADRIEGTILAGNIVMLAALAGTRRFPTGKGSIVCLEEVGEEPYRVDRALTQLLAAGLFGGAAGIAFGSMKDCVPEDPAKSFSTEEVLRDFGRRASLPICLGLPFGHGDDNSALPLGGRMVLERSNGRIRTRISV